MKLQRVPKIPQAVSQQLLRETMMMLFWTKSALDFLSPVFWQHEYLGPVTSSSTSSSSLRSSRAAAVVVYTPFTHSLLLTSWFLSGLFWLFGCSTWALLLLGAHKGVGVREVTMGKLMSGHWFVAGVCYWVLVEVSVHKSNIAEYMSSTPDQHVMCKYGNAELGGRVWSTVSRGGGAVSSCQRAMGRGDGTRCQRAMGRM